MPVLIEAGNRPKTATVAVIKIGRKRWRVPKITASFNAFPSARRLLMCESMITPFWIATPIKAIKPTAEETLSVMPRRFNANIPPKSAKGTTLIINAACLNLPQAAKRSSNITPNTNGTTAPKRL